MKDEPVIPTTIINRNIKGKVLFKPEQIVKIDLPITETKEKPMTDKQIIIDGVDVSGCCHQGKKGTCTCPHYKNECARNPNCHYKIMERQTKKIDKFHKSHLDLQQQLTRKTRECGELKAENETYKKMLDNPEVRVALIDVRTGEREVWRKLGRKAQTYKQALDEIEKIAKFFTTDLNINASYRDWKNIEDIINKAKEQ